QADIRKILLATRCQDGAEVSRSGVIDGVAPRISADHLEAVTEALGHLQSQPVVARVPHRWPPGYFALKTQRSKNRIVRNCLQLGQGERRRIQSGLRRS